MTKRFPLLRGIAILAVVLNHAAGHGFTAMFWWVHRYRDVVSPNFDQMGSLPYYVLVTMQQLATFGVPAFLFISGFFVAYATRGNPPTLSWKTVGNRVLNLLRPYLIWSAVFFVGDALQGKTYTWLGYLGGIVFGQAVRAYFFVPLVIQFYLLSPLLVRVARHKPKALLILSALVQTVAIGLLYSRKFGHQPPVRLDNLEWMPFWWAVYYPLGIVCGFHRSKVQRWLARSKRILFLAVIALGVLSVVEAEALYATTGDFGWAHGAFKLSSCLYALAFVSCFLAFEGGSTLFMRSLNRLGKMSYGIYLLHTKTMDVVGTSIYHFVPWILSRQILLQPIFVAASVAAPVLLMTGISRSRVKALYRYLFG
jgi:peptidoglycan/LPS O-acetylase OafA/YrhL